MITVIDYGLGNLASVENALKKIRAPYSISSDPAQLVAADGLIFPGVGAAGTGMNNIRLRKLETVIMEHTRKGKPLLGICLGMQLLFSNSEEDNADCLGLISGTVKKFRTDLKIPQIGWNQVKFQNHNPKFKNIFNTIPDNSYFYFVHSYYCDPEDKTVIAGTTGYDGEFCSVLAKENIYGVQFHPEKSGDVGLQLLKNFSELI